jgi:hypothetical protein
MPMGVPRKAIQGFSVAQCSRPRGRCQRRTRAPSVRPVTTLRFPQEFNGIATDIGRCPRGARGGALIASRGPIAGSLGATCRLNAMLWETLSGHGFHPLKAQLTCQFTNLDLSGLSGALRTNVSFRQLRTYRHMRLCRRSATAAMMAGLPCTKYEPLKSPRPHCRPGGFPCRCLPYALLTAGYRGASATGTATGPGW